MAFIVGVHGIAQQLEGRPKLESEWLPSLRSGVDLAGGQLGPEPLACAFYGELFRKPGQVRGDESRGDESRGDESMRPEDVTDDESELLQLWWSHAAQVEPDRVVAPDALVRGTSSVVQSALQALSSSRFFAGVAWDAMIGDLRQVRRYFQEANLRASARACVHAVVSPDTRVIVAHSLGSVVAYEALHAYADAPNWQGVTHLITLGSPLGIRNLIFDQLQPAPIHGRGVWPARIHRWTNIADDGDVVALRKELAPLFEGELVDIAIDNEARAHDISPYLTARLTGKAILDALR